MNKVWQCVSKPAILYGSKIFSLNPTHQLKLERIQRDLGRFMARGKTGCAITAIYGELGWTDLSHYMAKRTLNFFGHLGSGTLDPGRWSQLAFLEGIEAVNRGVISPWWRRLQELISTYDIDPVCFTNITTWRQHVKAKTVEMRIKDMEEKSTLRYYKVKKEYDVEEYLSGNKRYKYECFAIRTGQAMLNNRRCK